MTKLQLLARCVQGGAVLCGLIQCGIDASTDNLICTMAIVVSTLCLFEYILRSDCMVAHPVSTLMLIGFNATTTLTALLAQSLSGVAVIHFLRAPVVTFNLLSGLLLLAVAVHWVYRHLAATTALRVWAAEQVFRPLGALEAPNVWALWAMALLGALSTLRGGAAFGDVNGKVFQAIGFLQWLPFIIPLYYKKWGRTYCDMRLHSVLLALFVLALAAIGLARNARQLMLIGPFQAALIYFLVAAQDNTGISRRTLVKAGSLAVVGLMGITSFADLSVAMTVARDKRQTSTPWQVVQETFALLGEPEKLERYRTQIELAATLEVYDEAYLRNPVLARLSETKFHDNMLFYAMNFDASQQDELVSLTGEKLLQALPQPVLDGLNISLDKGRNAFSMGDYYRYLNEGTPALGGYATGSMWADMWSLTGVWMPFAAALLMLVLFLTFDSLSLPGHLASISPVVLGSTFIIFEYGLGAESLAAKLAFLLRDWPQKIVLYLMVCHAMRLFFGKGHQA
ncbi:MAG: hypothetical protein ACM3VZ_12405 [Acidobacteriota bacterium]